MENTQLFILKSVVLNPVQKLINHVTLGKSNSSSIYNNVNNVTNKNDNDNMVTGIY